MKKHDKLDVLNKCIDEKLLCNCCFEGESYTVSLFPIAMNEKFMLAQQEDDFLLNGYCIRKLSQLKKADQAGGSFSEICKLMGLTDALAMPDVDISGWQPIFRSLMGVEAYVEIEEADSGTFSIGRVVKAGKKSLLISYFDTDGVWADIPRKIHYSDISVVKWATRYGEGWKRYFEMTAEGGVKSGE